MTFEEFIKAKYPARSPKVLFQLDDVDGSKFYMVKEVQDQAEAWQARQAEVDAKDARIKELEHFNENQYKAINQRDLEFKKLRDLICKMLEDEHTYMRPSMAHECIVATGWRNDPN